MSMPDELRHAKHVGNPDPSCAVCVANAEQRHRRAHQDVVQRPDTMSVRAVGGYVQTSGRFVRQVRSCTIRAMNRTITVAAMIILGLLFSWKVWMLDAMGGRDFVTMGQIGDSYAPLTAFFSALAFIASWLSLRTQNETNVAQMRQLQDQAKAAETQAHEQRDAATAQANAFAQAVSHLAAQENATRALARQQRIANRLAIHEQLVSIDTRAHREIVSHVGGLSHEHKTQIHDGPSEDVPRFAWDLLVQARRDGTLGREVWHGQVTPPNVRQFLELRARIEQERDLLETEDDPA